MKRLRPKYQGRKLSDEMREEIENNHITSKVNQIKNWQRGKDNPDDETDDENTTK